MKSSFIKLASVFCVLLFMQSFFITAQCPETTGPNNKCHRYIVEYDPWGNHIFGYECEPPYPDDNRPDCPNP